jgi:hypothetical protein
MKKFLAAVALVLLSAIPANAHLRPKVTESIRTLQNVAETEDGEPYLRNICTVTSISQRSHLWVTAAHCVANQDMTAVAPGYFGIDRHEVKVFKVDFKLDLAILYTPDYSLPELKFAKKVPTYGDVANVWGHPFGFKDIVFAHGWVSSPVSVMDDGYQYMLIQTSIAPGNSGSAVLNKDNEIISIVQVGWGWFPAFEPMSGTAPFSVLKQFVIGVIG